MGGGATVLAILSFCRLFVPMHTLELLVFKGKGHSPNTTIATFVCTSAAIGLKTSYHTLEQPFFLGCDIIP